jgi:hypothetical protein
VYTCDAVVHVSGRDPDTSVLPVLDFTSILLVQLGESKPFSCSQLRFMVLVSFVFPKLLKIRAGAVKPNHASFGKPDESRRILLT